MRSIHSMSIPLFRQALMQALLHIPNFTKTGKRVDISKTSG